MSTSAYTSLTLNEPFSGDTQPVPMSQTPAAFGTSMASGMVALKSLRWLAPAASWTVPAGSSNTLPLTSTTSDFSQNTLLVNVLPEARLNAATVFGSNTLKKLNGVQSVSAIGFAAVPHCTTPCALRKDG